MPAAAIAGGTTARLAGGAVAVAAGPAGGPAGEGTFTPWPLQELAMAGEAARPAAEFPAGPFAAAALTAGPLLPDAVPGGGASALDALIGTSTRDWHAGQAAYCPASVALTLEVALQRGQSSLTQTIAITAYRFNPEYK